MAFRNGGGNRRGFGGGYGGPGGGGGGRMDPWGNQGGGNFGRQGGGGQGGPMNAEALTLANNLLNNLLRNQNPPSLLDLPRGGGGGGLNRGGPRQLGPRPGVGPNNNRNRRAQGGGFNRGPKPGGPAGGGGIRKPNAFDRAKKLLAKNSNNKPKKDATNGDTKDKKRESGPKESIYADVPNDMFYCHLCKKHMWDSNSFENHIKGRTHMMMREGIEESYRLKANMIRQEAKIAEQLKLIELDRLKRMGKGKLALREYCTMCDLNFQGHLSAHRKTEGHLALKKFLHPKCTECNKEFPTRIEYDTHLLLPEHLKKAAEKNTKVGERKKNTLIILTEEDELKDVKPPLKKKKKVEPKKEGEAAETAEGGEKKEGEDVAAVTPAEGVTETEEVEKKESEEVAEGEEMKADEEDLNATTVEDPEDCIIDYLEGEDVPVEVENRLPKYFWQRPVGPSLIAKLDCFECQVCNRFFDTEKTAEIHSRTVYHHRQFVKFITDKSSDTKIAQKRAAAAQEESERKRRKLEAAEKAQEDTEKNGSTEVKQEEADGDLYDPSEATGENEDEDVEMAETAEESQELETGEEEQKDEDVSFDDVNGVEVKKEEEEETKAEVEVKIEPASAPSTPKAVAGKPSPAKATPIAPKATPAKTPARGSARRGRYNR